ncbi:MAG: hypothetical protein FJY85_21955 [Deltaproteobacteria bacterium]|nr:hypothetical protein [Deltaproteobacteria bacterium]
MKVMRVLLMVAAGFLLSLLLSSLYAREDRAATKPVLADESAKLVGTWEIARTKEPGKPYLEGYKGRPFVSRGANAFTLIMEYRGDGTFRRLSRVGDSESVQQGRWQLSGHELRHQREGARDQEVMYVRFDAPDQYTFIEVYEDTPDPGLFAQFKKTK